MFFPTHLAIGSSPRDWCTTCLCNFSLDSSNLKFFETDLFDIMTTQNSQVSHLKQLEATSTLLLTDGNFQTWQCAQCEANFFMGTSAHGELIVNSQPAVTLHGELIVNSQPAVTLRHERSSGLAKLASGLATGARAAEGKFCPRVPG